MGRLKPAWYYQRQADAAERRADHFRNRTPPTTPTTIQSRGAATDLFYRSLNLRTGADPVIFRVSVFNDTLQRVNATNLGLMNTLSSSEIALRLRGSGVKPTRLHWYRGRTTPVRTTTPWGTRVSNYADNQGGQSHFSAPFSKASGTISGSEISERFESLFGPSGSVRAQMGAQNGRAWLELERVAFAYSS